MALARYKTYVGGNRYKVRNPSYNGKGSFVLGKSAADIPHYGVKSFRYEETAATNMSLDYFTQLIDIPKSTYLSYINENNVSGSKPYPDMAKKSGTLSLDNVTYYVYDLYNYDGTRYSKAFGGTTNLPIKVIIPTSFGFKESNTIKYLEEMPPTRITGYKVVIQNGEPVSPSVTDYSDIAPFAATLVDFVPQPIYNDTAYYGVSEFRAENGPYDLDEDNRIPFETYLECIDNPYSNSSLLPDKYVRIGTVSIDNVEYYRYQAYEYSVATSSYNPVHVRDRVTEELRYSLELFVPSTYEFRESNTVKFLRDFPSETIECYFVCVDNLGEGPIDLSPRESNLSIYGINGSSVLTKVLVDFTV